MARGGTYLYNLSFIENGKKHYRYEAGDNITQAKKRLLTDNPKAKSIKVVSKIKRGLNERFT